MGRYRFYTRLFLCMSLLAAGRGQLFSQAKHTFLPGKHQVHKKKKKKTQGRRTARRNPARTYYLQDSSRWVSKICYEGNEANLADSVVSLAKAFIGLPYRYGGADPRGFDCSGFVMYCFKRFGYLLGHHAGVQLRQTARVSKLEAMPGDLIFFGYRGKRGPYISHSGIVVKNEYGKIYFIHSASRQGIRFDCLDQTWYGRRFMGIGRVVNQGNEPQASNAGKLRMN